MGMQVLMYVMLEDNVLLLGNAGVLSSCIIDLQIGSQIYRPEYLVAMHMRKILKSISEDYEKDGTFVAISVPAHFTQEKRIAMVKSSRIAGLSEDNFCLVNDLNAGKLIFIT